MLVSKSARPSICALLPGVRHRLLVFLGILLWLPHDAAAQSTPAITSINPPSVAAGAATFTLTVNGSGYQANSVVQVNGSNRPTIFKSGLQITATIFATDIVVPTTLQITVFNPFAVGGGLTSNAICHSW